MSQDFKIQQGWTGMRESFGPDVVALVDEAVSRVIASEFPGRETNYLTTEGLAWEVLQSLRDSGYAIHAV